MMEKTTMYCDQCGAEKKETNHWWSLFANLTRKSMFISPYELCHPGSRIRLLNHEFTVGVPTYKYLQLTACGLECLAILESKIREGVNPLK